MLHAAVAAAYDFPADLSDEQILEKLLALNLERAAEEAKDAKVKKPKAQRGKPRRGNDMNPLEKASLHGCPCVRIMSE